MGGTRGKGGERWGPNLGQLGWRGDNFPILVSLPGIFLPPPEAATLILRVGSLPVGPGSSAARLPFF